MDLIYTDQGRTELGVIQNFNVDFDTTGNMDFQLTVGIQNNLLQGGFYWYIEGTEYGGRVDSYKVLTASNEIQYTGRNFRGILNTKVIEPPSGADYKILSGTMTEVASTLISDAGLEDLFVVDECDVAVSNHKFNRYVKTYAGLEALCVAYGLVPSFKVQDGMVHIAFDVATDYSDENEYTQDDLSFTITKTYANVNHLICLGKGDLKDRTVCHLYADSDGNISETQSLFGQDEITEIYENTNAEDLAELKQEGITRLSELKNKDSFEVTANNFDLKIGDIIGGIERVTNTYVAREIVNIIAKIDDYKVDLEYKVGEDEAKRSSSFGASSGGSTSTYNLPVATEEVLGGVKQGENVTIADDGTISADLTSRVSTETGFGQNLVNHPCSDDNAISGTRVVYSAGNANGKPTGTDHAIFQMAYNDSWKVQLALDWRTNKAYIRGCSNGTWSNWCDLTNYLPLTGGTVSGQVTATNFYASDANAYPLTSASGVQLANNGNLYMPWAGDWLSNVLGGKLPINGTAAASNGLAMYGYGSYALTYHQTAESFAGSDASWGHYIICSHGNGATDYHVMIRLPFWGSPQYQRLEGGVQGAWHNFYTDEYPAERTKCVYKVGYGGADTPMVYLSSDGRFRGGHTWDGGKSVQAWDYQFELGSPNYRWGQIYSTNAAISTSDRNVKKNIRPLTDADVLFLRKLIPSAFQMKDGTSGRMHMGFIAQEVEEAMIECGLTDLDFAGFCKDKKQIAKADEEGNEYYEDVLDEDGNVQYIYSLRYEEFIALNTKAIQYCMDKIDAQEERMNTIEERIKALEERMDES